MLTVLEGWLLGFLILKEDIAMLYIVSKPHASTVERGSR